MDWQEFVLSEYAALTATQWSELQDDPMVCADVLGPYCLIETPFPLVQQVSVFPLPDFGDTRNRVNSVLFKRSLNGTNITHVKRNTRNVFNVTFDLSRSKGIELLELFEDYGSEKWRFTNYDTLVVVGYCKSNPLVLQMDKRGLYCDDNDSVQVSFEFEGTIQ